MFDASYKEFYPSHFPHNMQEKKLLELATIYSIVPVYQKVLDILSPSAVTSQIAGVKFAAWQLGLADVWAVWQGSAEPNTMDILHLQILNEFLEDHFIVEPTLHEFAESFKDLTIKKGFDCKNYYFWDCSVELRPFACKSYSFWNFSVELRPFDCKNYIFRNFERRVTVM